MAQAHYIYFVDVVDNKFDSCVVHGGSVHKAYGDVPQGWNFSNESFCSLPLLLGGRNYQERTSELLETIEREK